MAEDHKLEGWITSVTLNHTKQSLQKNGLDWESTARALGFDAGVADCPDAIIPFETLLKLFEFAARKTGNDAIGLMIGSSLPIGTIGVFEYVGLSAPTLRIALHNWIRFHSIPTNAYSLSFEEEDDYGYLKWHVSDSHGPRTQFLNWSMGMAATRILSMFQGVAVHMKAELTHSKPASIDEFRHVLGTNIHFNQPRDRLGVPKHLLDMDLSNIQPRVSEPNLYRLMEKAALQELEKREHMSDQLLVITQHITDGLKNGDLSLENIAYKMAMSTRTLQRVLDSSGTSFRRLTEDTRKAIAKRYLVETDTPLFEIAFICGFSEQSAFSRAAKTWFGISPKAYRKGRGAGV